ncbi:metalloendopeptidase OMA1, mitochondrial-like [Watersipora subatra]|uniref:metalloendopeptidase OMA1, mitochondrial-like n=1 Tax=Watersipora subatra TaxID=2589382 RepID=UPI00355BFF62
MRWFGVSVNPVTGEISVPVKESFMENIDNAYDSFIRNSYKVINSDDESNQRVKETLTKIINSNRAVMLTTINKAWRIIIIEKDRPYSNVFDNGSIYMSTTLIKNLSDDELGFFIARAVAVTTLQQQRQETGRFILNAGANSIIFGLMYALTNFKAAMMAVAISSVFELEENISYSKSDILTADDYGMEFAARACFDIRAVPIYFAKIGEKNLEQHSKLARFFFRSRTGTELASIIEPSPAFRRQNAMKKLGQLMDKGEAVGCPPLDPSNDPIVDYELEEFKKNREAYKNSIRYKLNLG